ncbi:aldehyde dehydrogenase [Acaromyces ingoldii]|uniref:Aldehyde dehydrogenase n=1 Tax=Acaromyces ingoldii TaxID=215250 RepID=A0A316YI86_9BASI|nr:aldehyde dehydrogenase [Acaromyces ingoldii]PWN88786.1 aldehyde dehydrogenase [Acaromyces ingoldii]
MSSLLQRPFSHVIDGKLFDDESAKTILIVNPATEETLANVPIATRDTVEKAVQSAAAAFATWSKWSWDERASRVRKSGEAFRDLKPQLAMLLVAEQGKALGAAHYELDTAQEWFDRLHQLQPKEKVVYENDSTRVIERYLPLGVSAAIVPWNFPVLLMIWKILPAIIMGNTIIVKPSPFTPLCSVRIVEMLQQFFPPGVVQVLTGDDSLGPWLTEHPGIRKISFTGSTATGRLVARSCAATLKRFTLELGGNDASIIMPDIDVPKVAPRVFQAAFFNSGQTCHAAKRIYVHEDVYDRFAQAMASLAKQAKVGRGEESDTVFGPLNNKMQHDKIAEFIDQSRGEGHTFLAGGKMEQTTGYFAPLTIVDRPPEASRIVQEEPFGPIVPLLQWTDEEDLIRRVNDSPYGLGATVWGTDLDRVERVGRRIEAGLVWTNQERMDQHPEVAFGGFKQSGIGCENGMAGLTGWGQIQCIALLKAPTNDL